MRRLVLVSPFLLATGMARQPVVEPQAAQPAAAPQRSAGELVGLTATDLVSHFGSPVLQIHEGASLKLQFRGRRCVLDAYLYPSTGGALRVTHVDARLPSGVDTDQAACISALENPS